MFKFRNLLVISIVVVMLAVLMTSWASAQPAQQGTATPEATAVSTNTPEPTIAATNTPEPTAVAPAVSPLATPIGTPSALPTTGGSDDGTAAFSLLLMAVGALILMSVLGLTVSRRSR